MTSPAGPPARANRSRLVAQPTKPPPWRFEEIAMHQIRPLFAIPIIILCAAVPTVHAADPRFSGSASMTKPADLSGSETGRFSINANLHPVSVVENTGRFELNAKLQQGATPNGTTCGPANDLIFRNGFD